MKKRKLPTKEEIIIDFISSSCFGSLNYDLKKTIIKYFMVDQQKAARTSVGMMQKIFGNDSKNIRLYISFVILLLLISMGIRFTLNATNTSETILEFWKIIGPIITCVLGYVLGSK